jgi:hypothetical protein
MRSRYAVLLCVLSVVMAACGLLPPRQVGAMFPAQPAGRAALPVVAVDPGGLVPSIAIGSPDGGGSLEGTGGVAMVPGSTTEAVVTWLGGACEARTTITLALREPTIDVTVADEFEPSSFNCPDVGLFRQITLELSGPIGGRGFAWHRDPGR